MKKFLVENPWGESEEGQAFLFEWDGSLYEGFGDRSPVPCDLPDDATTEQVLELLACWYPRATSIDEVK